MWCMLHAHNIGSQWGKLATVVSLVFLFLLLTPGCLNLTHISYFPSNPRAGRECEAMTLLQMSSSWKVCSSNQHLPGCNLWCHQLMLIYGRDLMTDESVSDTLGICGACCVQVLQAVSLERLSQCNSWCIASISSLSSLLMTIYSRDLMTGDKSLWHAGHMCMHAMYAVSLVKLS